MAGVAELRNPHFCLRLVELLFAIIAFSTVAEAASFFSEAAFCVFCGVTTMVLALVFAICYWGDVSLARGWGAMVIDSIWWIFWLSCAAALSGLADTWHPEYDASGTSRSRVQCSAAFSWLTWFLYWGSCALDIFDIRSGNAGKTITMPAELVQPGLQMGAGAPPGTYPYSQAL